MTYAPKTIPNMACSARLEFASAKLTVYDAQGRILGEHDVFNDEHTMRHGLVANLESAMCQANHIIPATYQREVQCWSGPEHEGGVASTRLASEPIYLD